MDESVSGVVGLFEVDLRSGKVSISVCSEVGVLEALRLLTE